MSAEFIALSNLNALTHGYRQLLSPNYCEKAQLDTNTYTHTDTHSTHSHPVEQLIPLLSLSLFLS